LLLALAWVASPALAQPDFGVIDDPFPLRAADTSSPRDTLRTFIVSFNETLNAWQENKPVAYIDRPFSRAAETFDFTGLSNWARRGSMTTKMVLLKEILDRVELPPYAQIPGDEEVARENITRWIIPNTKIEIAQMP
jgi:MscS family membrane protein